MKTADSQYFKMKKVLIALDYDPTAQKVAEIGFSIAKAMKAEIICRTSIRSDHQTLIIG